MEKLKKFFKVAQKQKYLKSFIFYGRTWHTQQKKINFFILSEKQKFEHITQKI